MTLKLETRLSSLLRSHITLSLSLAALSSSPSLSLQIPNYHLSLRLCKFTERDKQSSTAMVAATKDSTAPSQPSAAPPEEDALKRNTDCVYFLASPLTCKKVCFLFAFFSFFPFFGFQGFRVFIEVFGIGDLAIRVWISLGF